MSTIDVGIKVTADARAAAAGMRPLETALKGVTEESQDAERALKELGDKHTIRVDDDAVSRLRVELTRLRSEMREGLRLDPEMDTREIQRKVRAIRGQIRELEREDVDIKVDVDRSGLDVLQQMTSAGDKLPGVIGGIGRALGAVTLGAGVVGLGVGAIVLETLKLADSMDQARIAFTQFLGTRQEANAFLADLRQFSEETPFEFPELVESSQQLLAFGIKAENIVPVLTSLGDAAALTGQDVGDLTTIWGQMVAKGRVANEELLQLTERGIPAYQMLADAMGLSVAEVQEMAEKGELLSSDTLPVLKRALDETFGGGMAKQAETLGGKFSTLQDKIMGVATVVGETFAPIVSDAIDGLTEDVGEWAEWVAENKATIAAVFTEWTAGLLDLAAAGAEVGGAVVGSLAAIVESFEEMSWLGELLGGVFPQLADALTEVDGAKLSGTADNLRLIEDGLDGTAGGLRNLADGVRETGEALQTSLRVSDFNTKLSRLNDELEELGRKKVTPEVRLERQQIRREAHQAWQAFRSAFPTQATTRANLELRQARRSRAQWVAELNRLKNLKPTTQVRANIDQARAKIREADQTITSWEKKKREARITALAKIDVARASLAGVADKKRTANIEANVTGVSGAQQTLANLASDRNMTVWYTYRPTNSPPANTGGGGGAGPQMAAPGGDESPVGFGALAAMDAGALAAGQPQSHGTYISGTSFGVPRRPAAPASQPLQLAPRTVPVKVFVDGDEVASRVVTRVQAAAVAGIANRRP